MSHDSYPNGLAMLVGREREQTILRDHLDTALTDRRGSFMLIGGEAGVGKTALAESICREAMKRGALALIGRCYELTETPAYGLWIELFRRYRPIEGMPLLPAAFARRGTVGEAPSQADLFQQIEDLLHAVAAQRPLVLFLDDVHLADPASLDALRVIGRSITDAALLIIATYRSSELTRHHPLYLLIPMLVREAAA